MGRRGSGGTGSTKKKSEGKGRTSEREEVRLVRAQTWVTWAKDAGGDAPFSVVTHFHVERGSKDEEGVCTRVRESTQTKPEGKKLDLRIRAPYEKL